MRCGFILVLLCAAFVSHCLLFVVAPHARAVAHRPPSDPLPATSLCSSTRCRVTSMCQVSFFVIPPYLQCLRVAEKSKSAKDCERDLTNKAQVTQNISSGQTFHPTAHVADHIAWRCMICVRASRCTTGALLFARRRWFPSFRCIAPAACTLCALYSPPCATGIIHKPASARELETMRAYVKLLR